MINCEAIKEAVNRFYSCEETDRGVRVPTDCLYPSFSRVFVYVVKHGDNFLVHDNGEAASCAWDHGSEVSRAKKLFDQCARRFDCVSDSLVFKAEVPSQEWLASAILSVANASAAAANASIDRDQVSTELTLADRIESALRRNPSQPKYEKKTPILGKSGKTYEFDIAIKRAGAVVTLVDTVTAHHNSIAAKYVAFADTERRPALEKFAVYDRELDKSDMVLMQNVADLIPIASVEKTFGDALLAH